jgi:RNA polymerase sigma factor (sigma-70 family)
MQSFIPTRRSLLSRLKNPEDSGSWQDFHDTYSRLILSTALHSGLTDSEAQDVLQETLVFAARKIPGFKYDPTQGSFKKWLLNATRWRITDQLRKRSRITVPWPKAGNNSAGTSLMDSIPDPHGSGLDSIWDAEWDKSLLEAAARRIKSKVRAKAYQAFELCTFRNWPAGKVAAALGLNRSQVYLAKFRVANLLKREIARIEKTML